MSLLDGGSLSTVLSVKNAGDAPLEFTCALHTYLRVGDLPSVRVSAEARNMGADYPFSFRNHTPVCGCTCCEFHVLLLL